MSFSFHGFKVSETDSAYALVSATQAKDSAVRPLWLPKAKAESLTEQDSLSQVINCKIGAESCDRVGFPVTVEIDSAFAEKLKLA
jgi:hypothetical protein